MPAGYVSVFCPECGKFEYIFTGGIMILKKLVILAACLGLAGPARAQQNGAMELEQTLHDVCGSMELWPGYDPLVIPLAVFDGKNTVLFRHPSPPEEFIFDGGLYIFQGRYPEVVGNSSAMIGGVSTATVMLESLSSKSSPEARAALVAHEGFHVFQGTTGRNWGANEVHLFTYPVDNSHLLALRRLETEALRRAFETGEIEETRAWALCALGLRGKRFALMDPASQEYEKGIEAMEGTASFIQSIVEGREQPHLPDDGFDAEDVRNRAYRTGTAWAFLLDRFSPAWREAFGTDDSLFLDAMLAGALRDHPQPVKPGAFTDSEIAAFEETARLDVKAVLQRRIDRREEFESIRGWRVVIEADRSKPLWPQGFDPLNVHLVEGGVIHSRFIKLGNESGTMEAMEMTSLTEAVGPHPLFNGVRLVQVAGFKSEPSIVAEGNRVTVSSVGFKANFTGASIERVNQEVVIHLTPPSGTKNAI